MAKSKASSGSESVLKEFGSFVDSFHSALDNLSDNDAEAEECKIRLNSNPGSEDLERLTRFDQNENLSKLVFNLSRCVEKMDQICLYFHAEIYDQILFYGEDEEKFESSLENLAHFLPVLKRLLTYQNGALDCLFEALQRLSLLYGGDFEAVAVSLADSHFDLLFEKIGRVLLTLITADNLIESQVVLKEHFAEYRVIVKAQDETRVEKLDELTGEMEEVIFKSGLFSSLMRQAYDKPGIRTITRCLPLYEEFVFFLNNVLEKNDRAASITASVVLFSTLFQMPERRLFNRIWSLLKGVTFVTLHGGLVWYPEQFLLKHLPTCFRAEDKKNVIAVQNIRRETLKNHRSLLQSEIASKNKSLLWMSRLETTLKRPQRELSLDDLGRKADLLIEGLDLVESVRNSARCSLGLHAKEDFPMQKSAAISACRMLENVKCVQRMFDRNSPVIVDVITHATQHLSYVVLKIIAKAKVRFAFIFRFSNSNAVLNFSQRSLSSDLRSPQSRKDVFASLVLAENSFAGAATNQRLIVLKICLSIASQINTFK